MSEPEIDARPTASRKASVPFVLMGVATVLVLLRIPSPPNGNNMKYTCGRSPPVGGGKEECTFFDRLFF